MLKYTLILFTLFGAFLFPQTNVDLISNFNPYPTLDYSDIWGYTANGREYALMGVTGGTTIIDVTNPTTPVEVVFIPGPPAPPYEWRDIKTHLNYAYIVTEGTGTGQGLQIVDLSQLPTTATLVNTIDTWFTSAHNIFIDNGFAYVIGTNGGGGMHILDLSDPVNPTRTSYYLNSGYIHDVYVWNDTVVVCAGSSGEYHLVDVTNKSNPQLISQSPGLPGIYAHSGWMTEDKRYFFGTEEFNNRDITVWDLQNRNSWDLVVPTWETNSNATVHNLFIKGNYAHISYYTDGYVVLDISNPEAPMLAGEYTTADQWGCYPYLPSGITICSDMVFGLYIFQFNPSDLPPSIVHKSISEVYNSDPVNITSQITDDNSIAIANLRYRTTINGTTGDWNLVTDPDGPNNDIYEFEIPGFTNQTFLEYYISAQDNNDNISTLPEGGSGINPPGSTPPPDFFSYTVRVPAQPIILGTIPEGDTTMTVGSATIFQVFADDTSGIQLSYSWMKNGNQLGSTNSSIIYSATQDPMVPRTDTLQVEISNGFFSNSFTWHIMVDYPTNVEDSSYPLTYSLMQNYPNPFNPATQIQFSIPGPEFVNLSVYNSLGEKVEELVNESLAVGLYTFNFDATSFSSGIYIARITAGNFSKLIKMSLLK